MRATQRQLESLVAPLRELRRRALDLQRGFAEELARIPAEHRPSACNLLHYLALRQHDLRPLQNDLAQLGLSSLGRLEPHVLCTLDAVLWSLDCLVGRRRAPEFDAPCDTTSGPQRLQRNARNLLGPEPFRRPVRIMVTMPSAAATEPGLIEGLLAAGMDVMRINCAHDGPEQWHAMIRNLRVAERKVGRSCKVYADLAGPKLRTGRLPGHRVLKLKVRRDARGDAVEPGQAWLTPAHDPQGPPLGIDAAVPLEGPLLADARPGDRLDFEDTRGRRRRLVIASGRGGSRVAEFTRPAFLETGLPLRLVRRGEPLGELRVGALPEIPTPLVLYPGDTLVLVREDVVGEPALRDGDTLVRPARIHCTLPQVFEQVSPGESIWFDDGKIGGSVLAATPDEVRVQITNTGPRGGRLSAEKGINLPETDLRVPALTDKDVDDLRGLVDALDIVGLSFVTCADDVTQLHERLLELGAEGTGVICKIESRAAFENLPYILLAAKRFPPVGVMVARGDLAVEVGFERLSEVQEEILWICEAAHVPVVWATQVLEGLAKSGSPSRAEVTDAAMSVRAECVMLNKGPHIVRTVDFLTGVLDRMHAHQSKKRAMMRPLSISRVSPFVA